MTNDLTTLSGALLEMKDELIYQLGQKGVTASYNSSTGLLGLIGQISQIQTGSGSCYNVVFDHSTYNTAGTATVSVTVLKNYAPCNNEIVTFTSSASTTTTATTNSSGVATATITFSANTTLTATIGGASDTASINIVSYLFYDPVTSDNSSTYYNLQRIVCGDNSPATNLESSLTYNSNGYYTFGTVNTSDNFSGWEIPNTYGKDNIRLRAKVKLNSSSAYCQFAFGFMTTTYTNQKTFAFFRIRGDNKLDLLDKNIDSTITTRVTQYNVVRILEIERSGGTVTINEYDTDENILHTYDYTLANTYTPSVCHYFFARNMRYSNQNSYIYEIKAEAI